MKISQRFLDIKNGSKDDYPGFQPKITPPKHFSPQCRLFSVAENFKWYLIYSGKKVEYPLQAKRNKRIL